MSDHAESLLAAFHAIYDVKDANYSNERIRVKAYATIQTLSALMADLGLEVPDRFDQPTDGSDQRDLRTLVDVLDLVLGVGRQIVDDGDEPRGVDGDALYHPRPR